MSIKYGLLSLLAEGENHGYQLKVEFERRTGGTWPVNIGQVYTTLERLARDDLVERAGEGPDGQVVHRITDAGRALVTQWFRSPVQHANPPRNELAIKFALAAQTPGVDIATLVQIQRTAAMERLQELVALRRSSGDDDLAWSLISQSMVFAVEAEIRWLDHCEAEVARASRAPRRAGTTPAPESTPSVTGRR